MDLDKTLYAKSKKSSHQNVNIYKYNVSVYFNCSDLYRTLAIIRNVFYLTKKQLIYINECGWPPV
jgi:hypothetical protein